jgi:DNA-binding MarR family transcriptional regulator
VNLTQREGDRERPELSSVYEHNPKILTDLGRILGDDNLRRISFYALDMGAVTMRIIEKNLGINHTAASRSIQALQCYGILSPAIPIRRPHGVKGGRRVTVYQTPEASNDQVAVACELQRRLESPKYVQAARFAQMLLEEYFSKGRKEITYRDLLEHVREEKLPFIAADIAELAAQYLVERGVKVWR